MGDSAGGGMAAAVALMAGAGEVSTYVAPARVTDLAGLPQVGLAGGRLLRAGRGIRGEGRWSPSAAVVSAAHLLHQYGYAAVFVLVGAESLGVPLPGETILVAAGIYAGSTHRLLVWAIFAVAAAAALLGDSIGFWIGDRGGYRLLHRYGRYIRVREAEIKVGRLVFDRHGGKVVFFGRFVSVLRTYAAFLAGTLKMRWRRFLPYNAAGGIVWAALYSFVPYEVGRAVEKASHTIAIGVGAAAAVVIVAAVVALRRKASQLEAAAEAAYPGPLPQR